MTRLAILGLVCALVVASPAHAYIDPGTGSMILQGLLATIAGALLAIRMYWSRIKGALFGAKEAPEVVETDNPELETPSE